VGTLACLTTLMLWSLGPNFIKYLSDYLDSWTQNCLRYSVAFLVCTPLFYQSVKRGALTRDVCKRALLPAAANVTMQSLWAAMFYHLNPALGVLLTKTNVLWVAAFSMLLIPAERVLLRSPRFWLGFGLSVTGLIGVVSLKETFTASASGRGIAMAIGAAFFWSVYTLAVKIRLHHVDSKTSFSIISLFTALGLWIVAACFGDIGDCLSLRPKTWLILVLSGILPIALGEEIYQTSFPVLQLAADVGEFAREVAEARGGVTSCTLELFDLFGRIAEEVLRLFMEFHDQFVLAHDVAHDAPNEWQRGVGFS